MSPDASKTEALEKMRETYEDATHVLVLDPSLEGWDSSKYYALESMVRMFTCGWMQRLWTLQEGTLAQRLWFQFSQGPVEYDQLRIYFSEGSIQKGFGDRRSEDGTYLGDLWQEISMSASANSLLAIPQMNAKGQKMGAEYFASRRRRVLRTPSQVARWSDSRLGQVTACSLLVQWPGFQLKARSWDNVIVGNPWAFMKSRKEYDLTFRGDNGSWHYLARNVPVVGKAPQEGQIWDRCTGPMVTEGSFATIFTQQAMGNDEAIGGEGFYGYITSIDADNLNFDTTDRVLFVRGMPGECYVLESMARLAGEL